MRGKIGELLGDGRPDGPCTGAEAALLLHEAVSTGSLSLHRSRGFLFLYELFTGTLDVALLSRDISPASQPGRGPRRSFGLSAGAGHSRDFAAVPACSL